MNEVPKSDPFEIRRALAILYESSHVMELRVPKTGRDGTLSGYFNDFDKLVQAAVAIDGKGAGIYVTLNPVNSALLARANNHVKARATQTTSDVDILFRRQLLIDCDPRRPSGISSTDAEHEAALFRARRVREFLTSQGWPRPALGDSSNGSHLFYLLPDLPNDAATTEILKRCLRALATRFDDELVEIDQSVFNPSRIVKLYGTVSRKGDNTPERPHRISRLLEVPDPIQSVSRELLVALVSQVPQAERTSKGDAPSRNGNFNLEDWIARTGLKVKSQTVGKSGGPKWLLEECPFQPDEHGGNPFIEGLPSGALIFKCFHGDCADKDWAALRSLLDPRYESRQNGSASVHSGLTQSQILVELAKDDAQLFRTAEGEAYTSVSIGGHRQTWPVRKKGFRLWLVGRFYREFLKPPAAQALHDALGVLEAQALFEAPVIPVFVRVAEHQGRIYIDLCNDNWEAVEIDSQGWCTIADPPVQFRRAKGMLPLPKPVAGGSISKLREFINVGDDRNWVLCACWLIAACRPRGPCPILILQGEQGSAKSSMAKILRMIIDPSTSLVRTPPRDDRDLLIAATNSFIVAYDNLSSVPPWLSDGLCRLATGGGLSTRELYTDSDEILFDAMRPVLLNGIDHLADRPDLADRAVLLNLPPIDEISRKDERRLYKDFERALPQILGALFSAVSSALGQLEQVKLDRLPRMADFAMWGVAAEPALGFKKGTFLAAYAESRTETIEATLEDDPVANAIRALMQDLKAASTQQLWTGTSGELLRRLEGPTKEETRKSPEWPKTPRALSGKLRRLVTFLREVNIEVSFHGKTGNGRRTLTIARRETDLTAAIATTATRDRESLRDQRFGTDDTSGDMAFEVANGLTSRNQAPPGACSSNLLKTRADLSIDGGCGQSGDSLHSHSKYDEQRG